MTTNFDELVRELALARDEEEKKRTLVKVAEEAIRNSAAGQALEALKAMLLEAQQKTNATDSALRVAALLHAAEIDENRFHPAFWIVEEQSVVCKNEDAVAFLAGMRAFEALKPDMRTFKKIVLALPKPPDFVEIQRDRAVRVKSDLSEWVRE